MILRLHGDFLLTSTSYCSDLTWWGKGICCRFFESFPLPLGLIRILKIQAASSTETSATQPTAIRLYQFCLKYVLLRQTFGDLLARSM